MCENGCAKRHYVDDGDKKIEEYRPTGFRWLTNSDWVVYGVFRESTAKLIQECRKVYGDVSLTDAFASDGERLDWHTHRIVSIYVKEAIPINVGITCYRCNNKFSKKDIVRIKPKGYKLFHRGKNVCLNCFPIYSYKRLPDGSYVGRYE